MDLNSWHWILVVVAVCLACAATGPGAAELISLSAIAIFFSIVCLWLHDLSSPEDKGGGQVALFFGAESSLAQRLAGMQPVILAILICAFALDVVRSDAVAQTLSWRHDDSFAFASALRSLLSALATIACCAAAQRLRGRRPAVDLLWAVDFLPTAVRSV
jgi:hypothetical protein